jgi:hypothetical protein
LRLKSGSSKSTSSHFIYGQTLASIINKNVEGVSVTNVETGASVDNMKRLNRGDIDIAAVVTLPVVYNSYHGREYFDNPHPHNRWLMTYYIGPAFVIVRADVDIYKPEDLEGRKINPGIPGSSNDKDFRAVMDALGIQPDYYIGSPGDAIAAIKDRRIAGYAKYSASMDHLDSTAMDLKTYMKIRIIPFSESHVEKVKEKSPWLAWSYIEKGQVKEMPEMNGFWTYVTNAGIVVDKSLPADTVYSMMKAIFAHREEMKSAFIGFFDKGPKANFQTWANFAEDFCPMHAGAVRFYREQGIDIPNRLIPPELKQ